jgi:hypothetical protein
MEPQLEMVQPQVVPFTIGIDVIPAHDNNADKDVVFMKMSFFHMSGSCVVFLDHSMAQGFLAGFRTKLKQMGAPPNGTKLYLPNKGIIKP